MTIAILSLIGAGLSAVSGGAYIIWKTVVARRALENSPEMKSNAQAGVDTQIEEQAKAAVEKADKGDLRDEQRMDA